MFTPQFLFNNFSPFQDVPAFHNLSELTNSMPFGSSGYSPRVLSISDPVSINVSPALSEECIMDLLDAEDTLLEDTSPADEQFFVQRFRSLVPDSSTLCCDTLQMISITPVLTVDKNLPTISIVDPPIFSVPFVSDQTQTVSIVPDQSENTDLKLYRRFIACIIAFSLQHPQITLKSVRMIFAKHFEIFDPRFHALLDSNDEPAGYFFLMVCHFIRKNFSNGCHLILQLNLVSFSNNPLLSFYNSCLFDLFSVKGAILSKKSPGAIGTALQSLLHNEIHVP